MTKAPSAYKAVRIDTGEEIFGDYLIKDPIFGWKIATTKGEYRVHADTIMKFAGESDDYPGNYVYKGWNGK